MPKTTLDDAVDQIRKWFLLFSTDEFVSGDLVRKFSSKQQELPGADAGVGVFLRGDPSASIPNAESIAIKIISDIIVNTQKGSYTSHIIMQKLVDFSNQLKEEGVTAPKNSVANLEFVLSNIISPFYETEIFGTELGINTSIKEVLGPLASQEGDGINSNPQCPTKNSPTVSIIFNRTTQIALSNKNGNAISIFLNAIPTMEWSRAIPFISIKFQFQRPAISADNRAITPSTLKFLQGSGELKRDSFDFKLQTSVSVDNDFALNGDSAPEGIGESGTELFLMPQTLINANQNNSEENRITPILDRFRPLASLRKFEVDVSQAAGMISYRTAKLSFTLHDRSRLSEIADFIKAGLYNKTEMLIEWGWEHPDKSGNNIFADFINGLRIKEKYQISNYDLDMKTNGEMDIDLSIFTKGGVDLYTSKIADSDTSAESQELVRQLQERISQLRQQVYKQDQKFVEEIRGEQILSTASDNNSNIQLSKELRAELKKTLSQLGGTSSSSAKELKKALEELYGTDGTDGAAKALENSISNIIDTKIGLMKEGDARTPDPFLDPLNFTDQLKTGEKPTRFVSLAKLLLLFVIHPLAATKKFDDIQVIFYNLNGNAGYGANKNLGEFPIEITSFQANFKKLGAKRRTSNLALQEFVRWIGNRYLEDISNPLYGLRELYKYEADGETGGTSVPVGEFKDNPTALNSEIEGRMKKAGIQDGIFRLPQIDIYVECIPASPSGEGEAVNIFDGLTVLRIHIFDKLSTSYEGQQAFLSAQRRDSIRSLGTVPYDRKNEDEFKSSVEKIVDKAKKSNLVEVVEPLDGGKSIVTFKGGPTEIKSFIAKTMPTMFYGVNNTSVLDAGLKTMQDPKLTTINMNNAGDKGDLTPNGGATNGLPIRLFPAQMNMRLFGCPIMEFTQTIFCDFGTGTSFDNIYAATKIQHSLEPGKFYTSVTMTPLDAYGQYQSAIESVGNAISIISELSEQDEI
jgi:hypothetical protein